MSGLRKVFLPSHVIRLLKYSFLYVVSDLLRITLTAQTSIPFWHKIGNKITDFGRVQGYCYENEKILLWNLLFDIRFFYHYIL